MKITGSSYYIKFDLENGYILKAEGERLIGKKFIVYKDSMKSWEPPHEDELVTEGQIVDIIKEVKLSSDENTIPIIFE